MIRLLHLPAVFMITVIASLMCPETYGQRPAPQHLTTEVASRFAQIALRCVQREFPNKLDHVMNDSTEVRSPRSLHPSFYGCYDWHSSVHGHWMLIRLLRTTPGLPEAPRIRTVMDENLDPSNIRIETAYLDQPGRTSFERTYGWAWLLKLAQELHEWNDPDARRWSATLRPLADAIAHRFLTFLPKQNYPIRTGVHPNTAFALIFALDYARSVGDTALASLVIERTCTYFAYDREYPFAWEPGGEDFFSAGLMEAELMRRALPADRFRRWFKTFAPAFSGKDGAVVLSPAIVTDRTDPKLVHLDGLNLSRAWAMRGIAHGLGPNDPLRHRLLSSAQAHEDAGLSHVASGNYEGEHWLATFAVLMLSQD